MSVLFTCPDETPFNPDTGLCALPCMVSFRPDYYHDVMPIVIPVLCGISFFFCWVFAITGVLRHEQFLRFPACNVFHANMSAWFLSFSFLFGAIAGKDWTYCDNKFDFARWDSNWLCGIQGVLNVYSFATTLAWWTFLTIAQVFSAYGVKLYKYQWLQAIECLIGYILFPLYSVIIGLSLDLIGFSGYAFIGCQFSFQNKTEGWELFGTWTVILWVLVGVNMVGHILLILRVIFIVSKKKNKDVILRQWRFVAYLCYFNPLAILGTLSLMNYLFMDEFFETLEAWSLCLFEQANGLRDEFDKCPSVDEGPFSPVVPLIWSFFVSCLGSVVFIIFACRKEFFVWWKTYLHHVINNKTFFPPSNQISRIHS